MIDFEPSLRKFELQKLPCPVKWTREHLHFWELGAYIESDTECWIELNPKIKGSFLGYNLQKIFEHELIHALRAKFPDSEWEELLAYQVSTYSYQKFLGPFLSRKTNALLLMILPLSAMTSQIALPYSLFFAGVALLFCWRVLKYTQKYLGLKRVYKSYKHQGFSSKEAFIEVLKLSAQELDKLSKKATSSVRNF